MGKGVGQVKPGLEKKQRREQAEFLRENLKREKEIGAIETERSSGV